MDLLYIWSTFDYLPKVTFFSSFFSFKYAWWFFKSTKVFHRCLVWSNVQFYHRATRIPKEIWTIYTNTDKKNHYANSSQSFCGGNVAWCSKVWPSAQSSYGRKCSGCWRCRCCFSHNFHSQTITATEFVTQQCVSDYSWWPTIATIQTSDVTGFERRG